MIENDKSEYLNAFGNVCKNNDCTIKAKNIVCSDGKSGAMLFVNVNVGVDDSVKNENDYSGKFASVEKELINGLVDGTEIKDKINKVVASLGLDSFVDQVTLEETVNEGISNVDSGNNGKANVVSNADGNNAVVSDSKDQNGNGKSSHDITHVVNEVDFFIVFKSCNTKKFSENSLQNIK